MFETNVNIFFLFTSRHLKYLFYFYFLQVTIACAFLSTVMRAKCKAHLTFLLLITTIMLHVESNTSYEAPHYTIFYILLSLPLRSVKYLLSTFLSTFPVRQA